jgi:hypothetical protein
MRDRWLQSSLQSTAPQSSKRRTKMLWLHQPSPGSRSSHSSQSTRGHVRTRHPGGTTTGNATSQRVESPEGWKAGKDTIQEGLPLLGRQIFAHYAAWSGFAGGPDVIHSCYDCSTRSFPSPAVDDSFLETVDSRRKALYRAFKFTKAICNDIEAANHAGITRMVDPVRPQTHP